MEFGMATTKVTITLPNEQLAAIHALVGKGQTPNVSAFLKHAVGIALADVAGWGATLRLALEETGGPLTAKERAWADALLKGPRKPRPRRRAA
jgi:Arc/MetJ-type ribon-helix-helix transcriptional regulator